jgi:hypothetical protein
VCGYTQAELEANFAEYIEETAVAVGMTREKLLERIRYWYNGYSWDGKTSVYNSFSTLLFFDKKEFSNYWFSTGTPTFLINALKKRNKPQAAFESVTVPSSAFDSFDVENVSDLPLLFQTGYLTIKQKELCDGRAKYTLGVPNFEVSESLSEHLFAAYSGFSLAETEGLRERMQEQLLRRDATGLEQGLREIFAGIPYLLHIKDEAYYHSVFLVWLRLLGFEIYGEIMTDVGRLDAVWQFRGHVVIIEVKFSATAGRLPELLDAALAQIKERRYADRYLSSAKEVSLLGVAFSGKEIACRMETLKSESET